MTNIAFISFGLLIAGLLLALFQVWRVHRRIAEREKAVASKLMEEMWIARKTRDKDL